MLYRSTRGGEEGVPASLAILKGLSEDGGLFMPEEFPRLGKDLQSLSGLSYQDLCYEVMKPFLSDFSEEELRHCIRAAYDEKFDTKEIAPMVEQDSAWFLELFHGKTIAFKDMALSILPHLMVESARKNQVLEKIVILTATSGDTGKAAMAGFQDVEGTEIIVFYPKDGVSKFQELQMRTQAGANTHVAAVRGNFDDAQTGVKAIFSDPAFKEALKEKGCILSSANSINIGRLLPQVAYYVHAYCTLLRKQEIAEGEEINVCVPTGNFGNILAAYFAKKMGTPIRTLLCASNENRVLTDFFQTGSYDKNRPFVLTSSPSMDILVSSNLERLLYLASGRDSAQTARFMESLYNTGKYAVTGEMQAEMQDFYAGSASEDRVRRAIRDLYEKTGYVIDPHTAVGKAVYEDYVLATGDRRKTVIASTASPYKFAPAVLEALGKKAKGMEGMEAGMKEGIQAGKEQSKAEKAGEENGENEADGRLFAVIDTLRDLSGVPEPRAIQEVRNAKIRHSTVTDIKDMEKTVEGFLFL